MDKGGPSMRRGIAVVCCALTLLTLGCSSDGDRPDTGDSTMLTSVGADSTTSTGGGSFGGSSALDVMLGGELTDIMRVRRYLDAERSGR